MTSAFNGLNTTLNGARNDYESGYAVTSNSRGEIFLIGNINDDASRLSEILIAKYDPALVLQSRITLDSPAHQDYGYGIAVDKDDNLFATGQMAGAVGEGENIWIGKFNSSLVLLSSASVNGPKANSQDAGRGITFDSAGNVLVVGSVENNSGSIDIWLGKYSSSLVLQSSTTVNGAAFSYDFGHDVVSDGSGNVYVAGSVSNPGQDYDIWIGKFDSSFILRSSVTINGSMNYIDLALGIAMDGAGSIYATGQTHETSLGSTVWIGKFSSSLVLQVSTSIPGVRHLNNSILGRDIGLDASENIFVAGIMDEADGEHLYFAKFDSSLIMRSSESVVLGAGRGIAVVGVNDVLVVGSRLGGIGVGGTGDDVWLSRHQAPRVIEDFRGTVSAYNSIRWTWGDLPMEDTYEIFDEKGVSLSGVLPPNTVAWNESGLRPGDRYYRYITAGNTLGTASSSMTTAATVTDNLSRIKAFPNPLRPSQGDTGFTFSELPPNARVRIYVLSGEVVRELRADDLGTAKWDGMNSSGDPVASGVYFANVEAFDNSKTLNLVIQR